VSEFVSTTFVDPQVGSITAARPLPSTITQYALDAHDTAVGTE
jgi:hypothetical protein